MIQRHRLLLNPRFAVSGVTSNTSTLNTMNGYQVNSIQGLGGGIVSSNNIRNFLADEGGVNNFIVNDFFSYLTGTTTTIEFAEIYNSNQKLSDVFNSYYQSAVVNNVSPSISIIDNSLAGTSGITVIENQYFQLDGVAPAKGLKYIPMDINNSTRKLRAYSALTTFTVDESYYVPVFISRNSKQMAGLTYQVYDEIVNLVLNASIENVDLQTSGLIGGVHGSTGGGVVGGSAINISTIGGGKSKVESGGFTITTGSKTK